MIANSDTTSTPTILDSVPNVGQPVYAAPMPIPAPTVGSSNNNQVPKTGIVASINTYDADDDSEFEPRFWDSEDVLDESAFLGINFKKVGHALGNAGRFVLHNVGSAGKFYIRHLTPYGQIEKLDNDDFTGSDLYSNYMGIDLDAVAPNFAAIIKKAGESGVLHVPTRILTNRVYHNHLVETQPSNYTGDDYSDFTGLSEADLHKHQAFFNSLTPAEQDVYSDFLGINFKKIGKAIGSAFKAVGKAGKFVGKTVGKVGGFVGKTIGKGAVGLGKLAGKGIKLGLKVLASQAGLDQQTDMSNGVVMPANWGAGAYGAANEDWNPELGDIDQEYNPDLQDDYAYGSQLDDLADQPNRSSARELIEDALGPRPEPVQSGPSIWLFVALAAFLGIGYYLVKHKKV
ncbi:hypothetical protein DYU05_03955 [Mucilaginibacter terrenus]|uniref:Uncharacterized protein n=1 Tax=Mucilaginibacter terrenus TaxID=2482727 RepID=A0A3E2NUW9_9SPHI|nr:hypothetical protein [Mucilaginibacter terrenus]RFZ84769.1 hypothetical protein DYU05_03955 [Mucilaginibacter terrenus]